MHDGHEALYKTGFSQFSPEIPAKLLITRGALPSKLSFLGFTISFDSVC